MTDTKLAEPTLEILSDDRQFTLLGTAHVSKRSVEAVEALLSTHSFDAVAVELCPSRYQSLMNPDALARMDLVSVVRQGKAAMAAASLALGAFQQRIAEQMGIEPGAEQKAAIRLAQEHDLPVILIDREIGLTLRRTAASVSWWQRFGLFAGLIGGLVSGDKIDEEEIERLKSGDLLESTFAEFADERAELYGPLINERDRYMAARLVLESSASEHKNILVVIGAGHLDGVGKQLQQTQDAPQAVIDELESLSPKACWPKYVGWGLVAVLMVGFFIGFQRNPDLGWSLVADWVLINGVLSALGALIALAHPLTVLTAFVAAPITSLNPTIGAGMVTASVELYLRKPQMADFSTLRTDTTQVKGWWRNRVTRTLLVFLLSTLGSAIGTYVAGFKIAGELL